MALVMGWRWVTRGGIWVLGLDAMGRSCSVNRRKSMLGR